MQAAAPPFLWKIPLVMQESEREQESEFLVLFSLKFPARALHTRMGSAFQSLSVLGWLMGMPWKGVESLPLSVTFLPKTLRRLVPEPRRRGLDPRPPQATSFYLPLPSCR